MENTSEKQKTLGLALLEHRAQQRASKHNYLTWFRTEIGRLIALTITTLPAIAASLAALVVSLNAGQFKGLIKESQAASTRPAESPVNDRPSVTSGAIQQDAHRIPKKLAPLHSQGARATKHAVKTRPRKGSAVPDPECKCT